jgi:UDP-GlcNAc:undecaprenyl-phosphate GlcNAc-1-phosphate transferase
MDITSNIVINSGIMYGFIALICAVLLAYTLTPIIRVLAFKIGAIDIPRDNRRMHKKPIPRIGGLAIFLSFMTTCLLFCNIDHELMTVLCGSMLMVMLGVLDDIYSLNPWLKLIWQLGVALATVLSGITIDQINIGGKFVDLGIWSIPITMFWIAGLTNAINIIDGLDGLSCGVSTISSISILFVIVIQGGDYTSALITLILIGSCFGFLPFNKNPAKIFMGDTGALFLGYTLAVISVEGMFKAHTLISLVVPLIIFALPLTDTTIAIVRRLLAGKSPFSADRGHLHHKLVDMGFTQKESVKILYSICGILGLVAVFMCDKMFEVGILFKSVTVALIALTLFFIYIMILKNPVDSSHTGLIEDVNEPLSEVKKNEDDAENKK